MAIESSDGDLANLSSVSPKGKVYQAKGTCDYTLWYGDKGGADKAINLVLVEAKKLGLASQGDDQALGYMGKSLWILLESFLLTVSSISSLCPPREKDPAFSELYSLRLSTDGEEFRFLRINEMSEVY